MSRNMKVEMMLMTKITTNMTTMMMLMIMTMMTSMMIRMMIGMMMMMMITCSKRLQHSQDLFGRMCRKDKQGHNRRYF